MCAPVPRAHAILISCAARDRGSAPGTSGPAAGLRAEKSPLSSCQRKPADQPNGKPEVVADVRLLSDLSTLVPRQQPRWDRRLAGNHAAAALLGGARSRGDLDLADLSVSHEGF